MMLMLCWCYSLLLLQVALGLARRRVQATWTSSAQ
jgi:hypothetical protein